MKPSRFNYYAVDSIDAAISLIAQQGEDARFLAGGQSLVAAMKLRLSEPGCVIDISRLSELNYIREDGAGLAIGATTTHYQLESSELVQEKAAALAQAAEIGRAHV